MLQNELDKSIIDEEKKKDATGLEYVQVEKERGKDIERTFVEEPPNMHETTKLKMVI